MFGWGPATRIYLAAGATDMRKGFEGLYGLVRDRLQCDPLMAAGRRHADEGGAQPRRVGAAVGRYRSGGHHAPPMVPEGRSRDTDIRISYPRTLLVSSRHSSYTKTYLA